MLDVLNTGAVFLVFSNLFDTVNHAVLLDHLIPLGLYENSLNWFDSFLSGRSQVTSINDSMSYPLSMPIGVPRVSILGRLLFIVYMNVLPVPNLQSRIILYVDNTVVIFLQQRC